MQAVYVVKGLGIGDDEDAYENIKAFATQTEAEDYVALLAAQDADDNNELEYDIEIVPFG
jgi:hypothetical protein